MSRLGHSKYHGVVYDGLIPAKPWTAFYYDVNERGERIMWKLGSFATEVAAAVARNEAVSKFNEDRRTKSITRPIPENPLNDVPGSAFDWVAPSDVSGALRPSVEEGKAFTAAFLNQFGSGSPQRDAFFRNGSNLSTKVITKETYGRNMQELVQGHPGLEKMLRPFLIADGIPIVASVPGSAGMPAQPSGAVSGAGAAAAVGMD